MKTKLIVARGLAAVFVLTVASALQAGTFSSAFPAPNPPTGMTLYGNATILGGGGLQLNPATQSTGGAALISDLDPGYAVSNFTALLSVTTTNGGGPKPADGWGMYFAASGTVPLGNYHYENLPVTNGIAILFQEYGTTNMVIESGTNQYSLLLTNATGDPLIGNLTVGFSYNSTNGATLALTNGASYYLLNVSAAQLAADGLAFQPGYEFTLGGRVGSPGTTNADSHTITSLQISTVSGANLGSPVAIAVDCGSDLGAVNPYVWGVNAPDKHYWWAGNTNLENDIRNGGIASVRVNPIQICLYNPTHAADLYPATNTWNFTGMDAVLNTIFNAGAAPIFTICDFPGGIAHATNSLGQITNADWNAYATFMAGVVNHYNVQMALGTNNPVKYWEMWNEPTDEEDGVFASKQDYSNFVYTVGNAMKAVDPTVKLIGPIAASADLGAGGWVSYTAQNLSTQIDILCWHDYGPDPNNTNNTDAVRMAWTPLNYQTNVATVIAGGSGATNGLQLNPATQNTGGAALISDLNPGYAVSNFTMVLSVAMTNGGGNKSADGWGLYFAAPGTVPLGNYHYENLPVTNGIAMLFNEDNTNMAIESGTNQYSLHLTNAAMNPLMGNFTVGFSYNPVNGATLTLTNGATNYSLSVGAAQLASAGLAFQPGYEFTIGGRVGSPGTTNTDSHVINNLQISTDNSLKFSSIFVGPYAPAGVTLYGNATALCQLFVGPGGKHYPAALTEYNMSWETYTPAYNAEYHSAYDATWAASAIMNAMKGGAFLFDFYDLGQSGTNSTDMLGILSPASGYVPYKPFYTFYLFGNYFGDQILSAQGGAPTLECVASKKSATGTYTVLVVNKDVSNTVYNVSFTLTNASQSSGTVLIHKVNATNDPVSYSETNTYASGSFSYSIPPYNVIAFEFEPGVSNQLQIVPGGPGGGSSPATLPLTFQLSLVNERNLNISWSGSGILQTSPALAGPTMNWTDVTTNNPATVAIGAGTAFFRVVP